MHLLRFMFNSKMHFLMRIIFTNEMTGKEKAALKAAFGFNQKRISDA